MSVQIVTEPLSTQMASPEQCVRIVAPHRAVGDTPAYHEWIDTGERVRADVLGRHNPRVWLAAWTKWRCNNPDCGAFAFVHDDLARLALNAAAAAPHREGNPS